MGCQLRTKQGGYRAGGLAGDRYALRMRDATRVVRGGLRRAGVGEPLHSGPVFAGPFHLAGNGAGEGYTYGRAANPTWTELEAAIGALEGGPARVFGSGQAAVAAVFGVTLRAGDTVAMTAGAYFGSGGILREFFAETGVTVRELAPAAMEAGEGLAGVRLVWVETPSNPRLEITDVRRVVARAREVGALVALDNTTVTPLGQRPLELGVDFSVCSDSKSMGGHSDLLLGHVAAAEGEWLGKIDRYRNVMGGIAGPMEAWLLLRSLATLELRLGRSSANALGIAQFLLGRKEIQEVLYPGLAGHPRHEVAAGQMMRFGPVVSFILASREAAESFLQRCELVTEATSFGGITTSAERRARWGHDKVAPGFVRLSAGCEDVADLIEDIGAALDGL